MARHHAGVVPWSYFSLWTARGLNTNFHKSRLHLIWIWPTGCLFLSLFAWVALADGAPGIWTRAFGTPYQELIEGRTDYGYSRHGCDYRFKSKAFGSSLGNMECISQTYYGAFPEQQVVVKLTGLRSLFGITVLKMQHMEVIPAPYGVQAQQ